MDDFDFEYLVNRVRNLANKPEKTFDLRFFREVKQDLNNISISQQDYEEAMFIAAITDILKHDKRRVDDLEAVIDVIRDLDGFDSHLIHVMRIDVMKCQGEEPVPYEEWLSKSLAAE